MEILKLRDQNFSFFPTIFRTEYLKSPTKTNSEKQNKTFSSSTLGNRSSDTHRILEAFSDYSSGEWTASYSITAFQKSSIFIVKRKPQLQPPGSCQDLGILISGTRMVFCGKCPFSVLSSKSSLWVGLSSNFSAKHREPVCLEMRSLLGQFWEFVIQAYSYCDVWKMKN